MGETLAGILVIGYLGTGIVLVAIMATLYAVVKLRALGGSREWLLYRRVLQQRTNTPVAVWRNRISAFLFALSLPVNWTAWAGMVIHAMAEGYRRHESTLKSYQRISAGAYNLGPRQLTLPIVCYSVGLLALRISFGPSWPVVLGLYVGQFCLVASLLSLPISTWDLATTLRRGYANPYIALGLTAAGYSVAVASLAMVTARWTGTIPPLPTVSDTLRTVLSLRQPSQAYSSFRTSFSQALTALASLALYYIVVSQAVQYKKFHRDAKDYAHIIGSLVNKGDLRRAREVLDGIPNEFRSSSDIASIRFSVAVLAEEWDEAASRAGAVAAIHADDEYPKVKNNTSDDRLLGIVEASLIISAASREHSLRAIAAVYDRGITDGALWRCITIFDEHFSGSMRSVEIPDVDEADYPITSYERSIRSTLVEEDWRSLRATLLVPLLDSPRIDSDRFAIASTLVDRYPFDRDPEVATVAARELLRLAELRTLPNWVYNLMPIYLHVTSEVMKRVGDDELAVAADRCKRDILALLDPKLRSVHSTLHRAISKGLEGMLAN
jgi:hypothetical protein